MDFISEQVQKTFNTSYDYFKKSEVTSNECYLFTLASLIKMLNISVNNPDFFEGCEDDIKLVLESLSHPLWKRMDNFEKLWHNPVWIKLCRFYAGIDNALPEVKRVTAFDSIDYKSDNLPFTGEDSEWTIFSKALLDVCYKSNDGECLSLLFKEILNGERISIGILYRCIDEDLGKDLGRNLKDEFLRNCRDMSSTDLQELVFLPLTSKKVSSTSFEDAMSILATMK